LPIDDLELGGTAFLVLFDESKLPSRLVLFSTRTIKKIERPDLPGVTTQAAGPNGRADWRFT
jgi:hypothetical protein